MLELLVLIPVVACSPESRSCSPELMSSSFSDAVPRIKKINFYRSHDLSQQRVSDGHEEWSDKLLGLCAWQKPCINFDFSISQFYLFGGRRQVEQQQQRHVISFEIVSKICIIFNEPWCEKERNLFALRLLASKVTAMWLMKLVQLYGIVAFRDFVTNPPEHVFN